jgi:hypothetical protein
MNLLIYSHSDYSYLWPIIEETIQPLAKLNPIFISNQTSIEKPKGFIQYIEYDESDCYAKRWIHILPQIESTHILVVHDVNIIISCDIDKIQKLFTIVAEYNIDRFCFNVFESYTYIDVDDDLQICDLNAHIIRTRTFIPYDQCCAIWKTNSYIQLWNKFPEETYGGSELNDNLQAYCKSNLKCYGIGYKPENPIYYCIGQPYHSIFKILHITTKGEITYPVEVYMNMKDDFIKIFEKYNLKDKIQINNNYTFLLYQQLY